MTLRRVTVRGLGAIQMQEGQPGAAVMHQAHAVQIAWQHGAQPIVAPGEHAINLPFAYSQNQPPQVPNFALRAMAEPPPYEYTGPMDLNPQPDIPTQQSIVYNAMHGLRGSRPQALRGPSLGQALSNIWRR